MESASATSVSPLTRLAETAYAAIAKQFPVCSASDEFYFFPQVQSDAPERWVWDDFTPSRLTDFAARLSGWEKEAGRLGQAPLASDERIDVGVLQATLVTLREQLLEIAPHRRQPTFALTVVATGLAEALQSDEPGAWLTRIEALPGFLQQALENLDLVPSLFQMLGGRMSVDLLQWLGELEAAGHAVGDGPAALERFAAGLAALKAEEDFRLPEDQFECLLTRHLGCGPDADAAERELREEYAEMDEELRGEAARLVPGSLWQELEANIPFVPAPAGGLLELYRIELDQLEAHARHAGFIPRELVAGLSPEVAETPASLAAIRAADAYSARVGHPARGGTFYVLERGAGEDGRSGRTLEYRMTAAHETWPGHHLLDVCRWNLPRPLRRPVERPLCYEGWACFAEQLLEQSGYFCGDWDRFLLARRRIERAARGLADLGLQRGRLDLAGSARLLVGVGYPPEKAAGVVPKYALRPGYQVCYTLGLRELLRLQSCYGGTDSGAFARKVLGEGEIGFSALEEVLRKGV